jgi:CubicO group peptidase (beta-lactamase class C family)
MMCTHPEDPMRGSSRLVVVASTVLGTASSAQEAVPGPWRQYASASEAGFSEAALEAARRYADSVRSGAVMAVYRGVVLAAWGDVARPLELHSVRKSVVSALYGIAMRDGHMDIDRTLAEVGIDDRERLTTAEKSARIRDLLGARSGVYLPAAYAAEDQDRERPPRGSHAPGTHFFYNNWDFNVLGVIHERVTGTDLYETLHRRIAEPLGMEDFRPGDGYLVYEPSESLHPAHTLRLSARDLARFGQLYLQQGRWNGRQLVGADWVEESTRPVSDLGGGRGYGYLWWTYAAGSLGSAYPSLSRQRVYAGLGTGGQLVLVVPDAQLVIVHRGDTDNGREVPGRDAWRIAELILAARTGDPGPAPALSALRSAPLASQAPAVPRRTWIALDSSAMAAYSGDYAVTPDVIIRVFTFGGRLFANFPGKGEAELMGLTAEEFTILPVPGVRVRFERDGRGRVTHLEAVMGPERIRGVKR